MIPSVMNCGTVERSPESLKWLEHMVHDNRSDGALIHLDDSMVEMTLPLPVAQASALEAAAWRRGLTVGQTLRQLVRDFLDRSDDEITNAQHRPAKSGGAAVDESRSA